MKILILILVFISFNLMALENSKESCERIEKSFPDTQADWSARSQECICSRGGKIVDCGLGKSDPNIMQKALGVPKEVDKGVDYFSWCKSQKNAFWDGKTQKCLCDENGKDVECSPKNKASSKTLEQQLSIPESHRGCHFTSEYQVFKLSKDLQARCQCTNKIPVICEATVACDGTDHEFGTNVTSTTCPQVKGECPSLKECLEDTSVDGNETSKFYLPTGETQSAGGISK